MMLRKNIRNTPASSMTAVAENGKVKNMAEESS